MATLTRRQLISLALLALLVIEVFDSTANAAEKRRKRKKRRMADEDWTMEFDDDEDDKKKGEDEKAEWEKEDDGKNLLWYCALKEDVPRGNEAEELGKRWSMQLDYGHTKNKVYWVDEHDRLLYVIREEEYSEPLKQFLLSQPEVEHVQLKSQRFYPSGLRVEL